MKSNIIYCRAGGWSTTISQSQSLVVVKSNIICSLKDYPLEANITSKNLQVFWAKTRKFWPKDKTGLSSAFGQVPYFLGDWSWNNFYRHSFPFRLFKKGCCQLEAKVCARSTLVNRLVKLAQEISLVRWTYSPVMTIAVDWDVIKQKKRQEKKIYATAKGREMFHRNHKVSKGAKIRIRYNQVPHLTQDTNGKVTNSQKTKSQSPAFNCVWFIFNACGK